MHTINGKCKICNENEQAMGQKSPYTKVRTKINKVKNIPRILLITGTI